VARGQDASPRGGQPERLRSGRLEHRERWSYGSAPPIRAIGANLLPAPIPFVTSSPSKDRPKSGFPKYDAGSWMRRAARRVSLGAVDLSWPCHVLAVPSCRWLCAMRHVRGNQKMMKDTRLTRDTLPRCYPLLSLSSGHLPCAARKRLVNVREDACIRCTSNDHC